MTQNKHPLWQRYLIKAAIDYFTERQTLACILVDNSILGDGVLDAMLRDGLHEFILCISPGYVVQLDLRDDHITAMVRFGKLTHTMEIPFTAIRAVLAAGSGSVLADDGHLNIIDIPPVIYAPGARLRQGKKYNTTGEASVVELESIIEQPEQQALQLVRRSR